MYYPGLSSIALFRQLLECCPIDLLSGLNNEGKEVFLHDIWPTREEIQAVEKQYVIPAMFKDVYGKIQVREFFPQNDLQSWSLKLGHLYQFPLF